MRVCIIGAGAAGLVAARHIYAAQKISCDVFEARPELGGVWLYTDNVETDQYGYSVHSAMYKDLISNLPKEIMDFPDFPEPEQEKSFVTQPEVLSYLNLYADHFNLRQLIKFNCLVSEIRRDASVWQVTWIHKPTNTSTVEFYDNVIIANGHYHTPNMLKLPNQENFQGKICHSQQYRSREHYKNQKVLVVGGGPSALDVTLQVSSTAKEVTFSHHREEITTKFSQNVTIKPDVQDIKKGGKVLFMDGSSSDFDTIIMCTGYNYGFSFLHESCGIFIKENVVQPLYKQVVNIKHPEMCFIGLPNNICAFRTFDIQARFYCQYLTGFMKLPPPLEMSLIAENEHKNRLEKGYINSKAHFMGAGQQEYFDDLAKLANITPVPPVIAKIWEYTVNLYVTKFTEFRKSVFKIVNNENFVQLE